MTLTTKQTEELREFVNGLNGLKSKARMCAESGDTEEVKTIKRLVLVVERLLAGQPANEEEACELRKWLNGELARVKAWRDSETWHMGIGYSNSAVAQTKRWIALIDDILPKPEPKR